MQDPYGTIHRRTHFVRIHIQYGRGLTNAEILAEAERQHGMITGVERCSHPCRTAPQSIIVVVLFARHDTHLYDTDLVNVPRILG